MTPVASPLEQLQEQAGRSFDALLQARALTARRIAHRRELLGALAIERDVAVVLMGSWGRQELTGGSDDDFMVLVRDLPRSPPVAPPVVEEIARCFAQDPEGFDPPGSTGVFADVVHSAELLRMGLEDDTNRNLTRRMLLVLESIAACHPDVLAGVRLDVVQNYLSDALKDRRPPRFLLNDLVRYWRTIGVDFVAKGRERSGRGWGLRNAKLRTSRKLLFASGLLPVLRCHEHAAGEIPAFLAAQFALPPSDRVADAFLRYGAIAQGAATLGAYDAFLRLLDDDAARSELAAIDSRTAAGSSAAFARVSELGAQVDEGLLALLFGTELGPVTQAYAVL